MARAEDASAPVEAEAAEDIGGEPAADDAGAMIASDAAIPAAAPADAPPPPMIPMPPVSAASEAGAAADAADAADAAAAAAEAAAAAAASGAEISQGGLVQIYAADGRPLLDDATVARLRAYDVTAFSRRDESRRGAAGTAPMPLALLRPHAYGQPIGILTPAGKIVTNADWDDISAYDVSMPLPVRTREGKAGAIDAGVRYLSVYTFSTENWKRSPEEVRFLMGFNRDVIRRRRDELNALGVRIVWSGRPGRLWRSVINELETAAEMTKHNTGLILQFCVNYGGRSEIVDAINEITAEVAAGKLKPGKVSEKAIRSRLYAPQVPDVDLVLRSSGEQRTSNFLLWQSAYAEMVFQDVLWPDVDRRTLWAAIEEYARRDRRFGGAVDKPGETPGA